MCQPIAGYMLDLIGVRTGLALFAAGWGADHHGARPCQQLAGLRGLRGALVSPRGRAIPAGSRWWPNISRRRSAASPPASTISALRSAAYWRRLWSSGLDLDVELARGLRRRRRLRSGLGAGLALPYYPRAAHPALGRGGARPYRGGAGAASRRVVATMSDRARSPSFASAISGGSALPRFLADPMWGMLTFWMPLYLTTARGFDLEADRALRLAAVRRRRCRLHVRAGGRARAAAQGRADWSPRANGPSLSARR